MVYPTEVRRGSRHTANPQSGETLAERSNWLEVHVPEVKDDLEEKAEELSDQEAAEWLGTPDAQDWTALGASEWVSRIASDVRSLSRLEAPSVQTPEDMPLDSFELSEVEDVAVGNYDRDLATPDDLDLERDWPAERDDVFQAFRALQSPTPHYLARSDPGSGPYDVSAWPQRVEFENAVSGRAPTTLQPRRLVDAFAQL